MSDLRDLYQEVILDHSKTPRNFGQPAAVSHRARGNNPLCGDKIEVFLDVVDGVVRDVAFEGAGCAISTASASIMTQVLKGKTVEEARRLFTSFHELLTGDPSVAAEPPPELGKLAVFAGVREYPVRVKCATLAWHTLSAALDRGEAVPVVSTE
jgi:nitrogen fixation NifU-like protein